MRVRQSTALAGVFAMVLAAACSGAPTEPDPVDASQVVAFDRQGIGSGPRESQRLRGVGGRSFAVHVEFVSPPGDPFDNCYTFLADGTWLDPGFPVPGTWTQHSLGAATTYTATAEIDLPPTLTLVQEGTVTPARGGGTLQLEAYSTVYLDGQPLAELVSRGQEVDVCPL